MSQASAHAHHYLDHAATTTVLPEARAAMREALEHWANPSSPHVAGRAARAALEDARARVKAALGWEGAVIFTSGATEAIALAWHTSPGTRKFAGASEHPAVLRHAGAARLATDAGGQIEADAIPPADLIAVQQVNNEIGVIQPLDAIAARAKAHGTLLLIDAAQSAGKLPLPVETADFIALSGHKFGGPPGVGALLVRDLTRLSPVGGQERGHRPGTENLPAILGLAAALEADKAWLAGVGDLRAEFEAALVALGGVVIAASSPRLATIGAYRLPGITAATVLIRADAAGVAISAGSACSSGSIRPSHVLTAMGMNEAEAREVFRVSVGRATTRENLAALLAVLAALAPGHAIASSTPSHAPSPTP